MGGKESKVESSAESKPASTPSSQSRSTGDAPEQQIPTGGGEGDGGKKLKPCCACPETKQARDECIVEKGEENCQKLIEAHKECLRKHGFKV